MATSKSPAKRRKATPKTAPFREDLNPFHIAAVQFDEAAHHLKLDAGFSKLLKQPKRQLTSGSEVALLLFPSLQNYR
jgi:hypothetical protein